MSRHPILRLAATFAVIVAAGTGIVVWQSQPRQQAEPPATSPTGLVLPQFSARAIAGKVAFDANCAACHGVNASGTNQGPPLVHPIYNPGHHADAAFYRAAAYGVRQHHWPFGNMPPQSQMTREQMDDIIRYVRELQEANGITAQPHKM